MGKRLTACVLLLGIFLCLFTSCGGVKGAAKSLQREGYTVRYYEEETAPEGLLNEDLTARLSASGPLGEVLDILYFKEKEDAVSFYEAIREKYENTPAMTAARKGNAVYYGTITAYRIVE